MMHRLFVSTRRILVRQGTLLTIFALLTAFLPVSFTAAAGEPTPQVTASIKNDTSPPLTQITPPLDDDKPHKEKKLKKVPRPSNPNAGTAGIQSTPSSVRAPSTATNFAGIGNGFSGPQGTFSVASAPPDTNGAVGPNHFVQSVNTSFAVFNKSGTVLYGPVPINTVWSGFGGLCQTTNDGDPVVLYDRLADRWVITQFAITGANGTTTPFLLCAAVSTTPDPTGSYYRYSFPYANFPDYPKFGVWPDGYYFTTNEFNAAGTTFLGARTGVFDRSKMLLGQPATQITFGVGTSYGGILPATLDGATSPPTGSPEWIVGLGTTTSSLAYWKFHTDFTTPANSTLTGPTALSVNTYAEACGSGGTCIPQSGTTQQLDSLADRLMYRLAYRNFGDHEALVVDHNVTAGSSTGVRWYELRPSGGALSVFQQGTYAPDANYRWMGSIAMDKSGDMAMGFSLSGSSLHPAIAYTGRLVGDAQGVMGQGEGTVISGGGSQTTTLSRWGDYSTMSIDPSDDCTFWYTNEYIPANGTFNWSTRIASFKFPSCGGVPPTNDFSISASPTSLSVSQGASGTSTISTAITSGSAQSVSLSVSGVPAGATASFNPTSVNSGGSSTLTINSGTAAPGTYSLTVTGTSATATHTTSVNLTVTGTTTGGGLTNGGFETGSLSGWTSAGSTSVVSSGAHSGTYAAIVGATTPTSGDSSILQTFTAPTGGTGLSFWYNLKCPDTVTYDWATATLKDNTSNTTSTVLAKTCTNTNTWTQVTAALTAGHSYTLTLVSHDDNYAGDPTYTLYDDVAITTAAPPPTGVVNGGFETGSLSSWTSAGTTSVVSSGAHSGTYAARLGATNATNGDSSITQTFTASAGATKLSLWYANTCPDTVTYDWATATLKDNTSNTTTTILAKTCTKTAVWTNVTTSIVAGHSYTLTLISHDDNYAGDPTYTLYDDIVIQ